MQTLGLDGPALIVASATAERRLVDTWRASLDGVAIAHCP
jgi:hypothetical protein